ncbi:MAG: thiazole synthase [[Chlorobium] sp. 445]|nr:MAG: thiazole synthase [[Chlorobium] sp. 445]
MSDLSIAGRTFHSRLLVGTAKYPNPQTMLDAIEASGAEIVTLAIRRIDVHNATTESIVKYLEEKNLFFLPNTAGCYTAKDAVLTAQLAREALNTNWIKLEVIGDDETLFPDTVELLKAAELLLNDGFVVLAYTNDDPITCKKLYNLGCHAVMPLASPIGSGMGIRNPYNLQIIRELLPDIPLIIDAGIGTASDAAIAMELGYDGVLLNTAISQAQHPVQMAEAMKLAVRAGRLAYEAGRIPRKLYATASSPLEGIIGQ